MRERTNPTEPKLFETVYSLDESLRYYEYFSERASNILRQLGFAGLAVVWIFKVERNGSDVVPAQLFWPALLLVVALALDLLHYVVGTAVWMVMFWSNDRKRRAAQAVGRETTRGAYEVHAHFANLSTEFFFWPKALITAVAYLLVIIYLWGRLE